MDLMPAGRFRWSKLPHAGADGRAVRSGVDALRCDALDRALASGDGAALVLLGEVVAHRRRVLLLDALERNTVGRPKLHASIGAVSVFLVGGVAAFFVSSSGPSGGGFPLAMLLLFVAGLSAVTYWVIQRVVAERGPMSDYAGSVGVTDRMSRAAAALVSRECPCCGYSLASLDAVERAMTGGEALGPVACPECGERWPLVPPPLAGDGTRELLGLVEGGC